MKQRYRISPESGRERLSDADVARYRNGARLLYNYHKAVRGLHRKPLYKDPRAFVALLIIVLLAVLIAEVVEREGHHPPVPPPVERPR